MKKNQSFSLHIAILSAIILSSLSITTAANAQRRRAYVERGRPGHIMVLPPHHYPVVVHGRRYFYGGGFFYRPGRWGYVAIPAPLGARIRVLPFGYMGFRIGPVPYYYFGGVYYRYIPDENVYVVVEKPSGAPAATTSSNDNNDKAVLTDGTTLSGVFIGATQDSVQFQVNGEVQNIPITKITSIDFAPSAFDTTGHR
jgi:Family of unknown function (DUF6515)